MKPRRRRQGTVEIVRGDGAERFGNEDLFVVWDTRQTVGNSALLWAQDAKGYTCDLSKAHKYTRSEIESRTWRDTDVPVRVEDAISASERHVRAEQLRRLVAIRNSVEGAD